MPSFELGPGVSSLSVMGQPRWGSCLTPSCGCHGLRHQCAALGRRRYLEILSCGKREEAKDKTTKILLEF